MASSVFDFDCYRTFLADRLGKTGPSRGGRSKLAAELGVKGAFISQVLSGKLNLSLEQALLVCEFLSITGEEQDYFLLLVNAGRAGSKKLEEYFGKKIGKIRASRKEIKSRVKSNHTVSEGDQLEYFSSWLHSALHALITIPAYQEPKAMAKRLGLSPATVQRRLAFLEKIGIAEKTETGRYRAGKARFHIDSHHPQIHRHHMNWRERSLIPLSGEDPEGQHYTCVLSASPGDAEKIRALWLKFLEGLEPIIEKSPEEELYAIQWDFFRA